MGEIFAGRYELVDPIGRGGVGVLRRPVRRHLAARLARVGRRHAGEHRRHAQYAQRGRHGRHP